TTQFQPLDPNTHKPFNLEQILTKKLRWITLGGQYDWTEKRYPDETPPEFPPDIAQLIHDLFPPTKAEAAILNFYSPGDTLSLHRDVSEECEAGLVSISLGCDGIFLVGLEGPGNGKDTDRTARHLAIRLRSGDAVFMTGPSRFAWHGVPQIVAGTCPDYLSDWPLGEEMDDANPIRQWRGWMEGKRINLNVRQMKG
ncbi:hypothetical protein LTS18_014496, partial [Coniosporium uncinatum]